MVSARWALKLLGSGKSSQYFDNSKLSASPLPFFLHQSAAKCGEKVGKDILLIIKSENDRGIREQIAATWHLLC